MDLWVVVGLRGDGRAGSPAVRMPTVLLGHNPTAPANENPLQQKNDGVRKVQQEFAQFPEGTGHDVDRYTSILQHPADACQRSLRRRQVFQQAGREHQVKQTGREMVAYVFRIQHLVSHTVVSGQPQDGRIDVSGHQMAHVFAQKPALESITRPQFQPLGEQAIGASAEDEGDSPRPVVV